MKLYERLKVLKANFWSIKNRGCGRPFYDPDGFFGKNA